MIYYYPLFYESLENHLNMYCDILLSIMPFDNFPGLFKISTTKNNSKPTHVKKMHVGVKIPSKLRIQKKSKAKIIKYIKSFSFKKENEAIKGRIIRDITNQ